MSKTKLLLTLALTAFAIAPAFAEEGTSSSYALKKQGRVPFSSNEAPAAQDQNAGTTTQDPSTIEPAAGASEEDEQQQGSTQGRTELENSIRLPRKN
jgi:hypothetical protein